MFFLLGVYFLSDFINQFLHFDLNGKMVNDFFYCVFGIGAVEELMKIIPLLLLIRFTKAVHEPYDYILYASLSALGFAFIENLKYFDERNLNIIHGRALASTVSHMFDSSIIAYGLILNRYKRKYNPGLNFMLFFLLAALAHGFYDFWLINKAARDFSIFTILFLIVGISVWDTFLNNALNNSDFFDKDKQLEAPKLRAYLIYSLSGILLFEYAALSIKYGPSVGGNNLFSSIYGGTYLLLFISSSLSRFKLVKGKWLGFMSFNKNQSILGERQSSQEGVAGKNEP
jgi:hypothetical protein